MAKIHLDRVTEKYGWKTHNYRVLMSGIIADNAQRIHNSVSQMDHSFLTDIARKLSGTEQAINIPRLSDVLKPQSQWTRKGADRGKLITDSLKDKLSQDLRTVLDKPEYMRRRGKLTGTLKNQALLDMRETMTRTFRNYTKVDPSIGIPKNIKAIVSTELRSVVNQTKQEFNRKLLAENPDLIMVKKWIHNGNVWGSKSYKARKHHQDLHGHEVAYADNFILWNKKAGTHYNVPYPHYETLPPEEVINCVIGETRVSFLDIKKILRRNYQGEIFSIKTEHGFDFSLTPNHPVLTSFGWIRADEIKKGTDLIGLAFTDKGFIGNKNIYNIPTKIKKIFNFFRIESMVMRKAGIDFYFNSKFFNSKIDIITTDGILRNQSKSFFLTPFKYFIFSISYMSYIFLSCFRIFYSAFERHFVSFHSFVGIGSKLFSFKFGQFFHSYIGSIGGTSDRNILFDKSRFDSISVDTVNFRKRKYRCAFFILRNRGIDIKFLFNTFEGTSFDIIPIKDFVNRSSTAIIKNSKLLARKTAFIFLDNVISVNIKGFSGHVYNLHTENNYYLINTEKHNGVYMSSIIHNCNCEVQYRAKKVTKKKESVDNS